MATTYYALDNAETIDGVYRLNLPLRDISSSLPVISLDHAPSPTMPQLVRRTRMHKWWQHEVMACNFDGITTSAITPGSPVNLLHFNPKAITWLRERGVHGPVRTYLGLKYMLFPIVKGRTIPGFWNEEFNDDTRLILTDADITSDGAVPAFFATLDALRDFMLDDDNDALCRDLAECMMLEFLLDGAKVYVELAQHLSPSTKTLVVTDIVSQSQTHGWGTVLANIRNRYEASEVHDLEKQLRRAASARTGQRSAVMLSLLQSDWYECSDAFISLMKCRATVRANEPLLRRMPNAVKGNQWMTRFYDCDVCDEISFELWTRLCGFAEELAKDFTSDMSGYVDGLHLATNTEGLSWYNGSSYVHKGLTVSKPRQYDYVDQAPPLWYDLPARKRVGHRPEQESNSLCVHVMRGELVVVSTRFRDRLVRFIRNVNWTISLPIVQVSRDGSNIEEALDGPGPNAIVSRVLKGEYGTPTVMWLLSHMFAGNLAVNAQSQFRGFVPRLAMKENGLALQAPLPADMMRRFKVIRRRVRNTDELYWAPMRVGNVFRIHVGKSMVHMEETERDIVDDSFTVVCLSSYKDIS